MRKLLVALVLVLLSFDEAHSRRSFKGPSSKHKGGGSCLSGDGSQYRGSVSVSDTGRRCVSWDLFTSWVHYQPSKGLGPHNHCRNPNLSLKPWCRVQRGTKFVREFCNIPRCQPDPVPPAVSVDTALTCGERVEPPRNKIVGGSVAPVQAHPWLAAIFKGDRFLCGGTLIAPCWVLSAAHCFENGNHTRLRRLSVFLGKGTLNQTDQATEQKFTVEQLVTHPEFDYSRDDYENDIVLLKINGRGGSCAVRTPWTRTACLPPPLTALPPGVSCTLAGFGYEAEEAKQYSQVLKHARVQLLSQRRCRAHYPLAVTDNMFCASSPDWSTDACQGDSGGPLVLQAGGRAFLLGVVSWGEGCARPNRPGVFTRLTNYNRWIARVTGLPAITAGTMYPQK